MEALKRWSFLSCREASHSVGRDPTHHSNIIAPLYLLSPLALFLFDLMSCIRKFLHILGGHWNKYLPESILKLTLFHSSLSSLTVVRIESECDTHIAGRGERPGLLSLPLLFPWSIAPFISSRMALARELRVGLPMEAVVYRGMLFSAIEAWKAKPEALNVKRKRVVSTSSVAHQSFHARTSP